VAGIIQAESGCSTWLSYGNNSAAEAAEREYEIKQTERTRILAAEIKAENLERKLTEAGPGYVPREVKLHRLPEG